jgi:hypothetical protein
MLKLSNIKDTFGEGDAGLKEAVADLLGIPETSILSLTIQKRSVDARIKTMSALSTQQRCRLMTKRGF